MGDSGGPGFVSTNGVLKVAAVTSGGTEYDCGEGFGVDTSVYAELAWIDGVVGTTDDDDDNPDDGDDSADESGMETGDGTGETSGTSGDDGGCSTTGSGSSLVFVGLAAVLVRRRRR